MLVVPDDTIMLTISLLSLHSVNENEKDSKQFEKIKL